MTSFLIDAERIFEVAQLGDGPEDFTIRISPENGIYIVAGPDYSYSADTTYRVRRGQGKVTVEGRSGDQICNLQTTANHMLFIDRPAYLLA